MTMDNIRGVPTMRMKSSHRSGQLRSNRTLPIHATLMIVATLLTACGQDVANGLNRLLAMKPPYPDTESKLVYAIHSLGGPDPIYWIDDSRVLFPGYELNVDKTPYVIIWNTADNTYVKHAPLLSHFWMCFNRGFLAYNVAQDTDGRATTMMAGPLGAEKQLAAPPAGEQEPELKNCESWPNSKATPEHPNARMQNLAPEDGYIVVEDRDSREFGELSQENENQPVRLYRPNKPPVDLPILRKEIDSNSLTYSEYARVYILIPWVPRSGTAFIKSSWPSDQPMPIYEIDHGGQVTVKYIPAGVPEASSVFETRKGILWVSNVSGGNSRNAGAWLLVGEKPQKVIEHFVKGLGVSPDGCKIAYSVNAYDPKRIDVVHVMNVCKGS